jgi:hypothetical protein
MNASIEVWASIVVRPDQPTTRYCFKVVMTLPAIALSQGMRGYRRQRR